jgi:hypothetical protein
MKIVWSKLQELKREDLFSDLIIEDKGTYNIIDPEIIVSTGKENLLKENLLKENLLKENLLKENLLKENLLKENLLKENLLKKSLLKENITKNKCLSSIISKKDFG